MMTKQKIMAVVGPTASGKSALAVRLAELLPGEIVACDSMQIYRDMPIGTAVPTKEEQARVPHHLYETIAPDTPFSLADYVSVATEKIKEISERCKVPVLCGGTGLYLDALIRGADMTEIPGSTEVREALMRQYEQEGLDPLYARLQSLDTEAARTIHPHNVKRVIRALEICLSSGYTKTAWDSHSNENDSPYLPLVVGLQFQNRDLLYKRIDKRVDEMMQSGLPEEAKMLMEKGVFDSNTTAAQAIGYKELFGWLKGEESRETAVNTLKTATHHYAKRQMTWFRAKPYVWWVDADRNGDMRPTEELVDEIIKKWRSFEEGNIKNG